MSGDLLGLEFTNPTDAEKEEQSNAARRIQAIQRGKQLRKERAEQAEAARKMQAVQRGRNARKLERNKQAEKMTKALKNSFDSKGITWGLHPITQQPACVGIDLSSQHIKSVTLLPEKLPWLQKVNISQNSVTSISSFKDLKFLQSLEARQNKLRSCLDFNPPHYDYDDVCNDNVGSSLVFADLSFNRIVDTSSAARHQYLRVLVLDNNNITSLDGLGDLKYLIELSASHNHIKTLRNWSENNGAKAPRNLQSLNLGNNEIVRIDALGVMTDLQIVNLKGNDIRSLYGLQNCEKLNRLCLDDNPINSTNELDVLSSLNLLQELSLQNAPVQSAEYFRWRTIKRLPHLVSLDGQTVSNEEKVKSDCAHGGDVKRRMDVWQQCVGKQREFIQTVPVIHPPVEKEEEEFRNGTVEQSRTLLYRGRRQMCKESSTIDIYFRGGDGSNYVEAVVYSDSGSFKLFSSLNSSLTQTHAPSVLQGETLFYEARNEPRPIPDIDNSILGVGREDLAAAISQRLQIRIQSKLDNVGIDCSNLSWVQIKEKLSGTNDFTRLVIHPPPVAVGCELLYGMQMCVELTRDIDSRILISASTLDNIRATAFEASYEEDYARLSMADVEGIDAEEFSCESLYQAIIENCLVERPKGSQELTLMIPSPPPDGPTMELEIAKKRARKKFDQLDADGSGTLEGDELNGLAAWVWSAFHPGGEPITEREKAKITKKLTSRLTRSGQMNFDDFQQWFTKTCEDIQSFRKLKSKYGSSRKK
jgi:hypothetical protein|eukprot:Stramenopile-MAST_4_protein_1638